MVQNHKNRTFALLGNNMQYQYLKTTRRVLHPQWITQRELNLIAIEELGVIEVEGELDTNEVYEVRDGVVTLIPKEIALTSINAIDMRRRRDKLLAECDWTQLPDVPEFIRLAWAPYRQALRDITTQPEFPLQVTWPSAPIT